MDQIISENPEKKQYECELDKLEDYGTNLFLFYFISI